MKALLVAVNAKYIHTSLSVRTLKAYANSDNVEMAEYTINERVEDILRSIFLKKADVVLFSCYIWNVEVCLDVADMLKKVSPETKIIFGGGLLVGEVVDIVEEGNRLIHFEYEGIFEEILDQLGEMPLPPYITHKLQDKNRYQTVYAKHEGSAAAPTAGLHFTPELLAAIEAKGIRIARVTLHVGLGTFRPVKVEDVTQHHMHSEYYQVTQEAADIINDTKKRGGRVIAVGTTSTRTLESVADEDGTMHAAGGWTEIFIYPGYKFKCIDALITNFHLPESTLLMLVSALAGKEHIMHAYETAVQERYRFFSFGDAMFIK